MIIPDSISVLGPQHPGMLLFLKIQEKMAMIFTSTLEVNEHVYLFQRHFKSLENVDCTSASFVVRK